MLYSTASFIFVLSIIAGVRQLTLAKEERFSIEFRPRLPSSGRHVWDKLLSAILVIAILGTLATLGYVLVTPKVGGFTEFYILGVKGKAADCPTELAVGQEGKGIIGIINREYRTASYRVEISIDGVRNNEVRPSGISA